MLVVEVDVDIGHFHALFRKEAFEEEAVRKRVEVGNAHSIGDDGAGRRATARSYADAVVLGPHDVFLHDQEVGRETLLDDDVGFVLVALDHVGAQLAELFHVLAFAFAIALDEPPFAFLAEPADLGFAVGHGELGQNGVALEDHIALFGDLEGIVASFGEVLQSLAHFLFSLHVELVGRKAHAVDVVDLAARADAEHDVLGLGVFVREVVEVVGRDGLQTAFARDLRELNVELLLGVACIGHYALVLQLDVEIAWLEAAGELFGPSDGVVVLHVVEKARDDAGDAGGGTDKALAVLLQHRESGARLVVEVVDMGLAHEFDEVVIAFIGFGQQDHVVEAGLALALELVVGGEVDLAAENRLDLLARFLFEGRAGVFQFGHATHDAMVGDGNGGHSQIGRALDHVFHMRRAVEQGVLRMIVQVNKRHGIRLRYVL